MRFRLNVPVFGLSLVLSLLMWLIVQPELVPVPWNYSVKLNAYGLDPNRYWAKSEETISLTASGSETELKRFDKESISAYVDLSDATPGTRAYPVRILPEGFAKYMDSPKLYTRVTVEPIISRTLAVDTDSKGKLVDAQAVISELRVMPTQALISGPKSQVDRVSQLRATLDLTQVDATIRSGYPVPVEPLSKEGASLSGEVKIDPPFARVIPVVESAGQERTVLVSPSFTGSLPDGLVVESSEIVPNQVRVSGPSLAVAGLTRVETEPINLANVNQNTTLTVRLRLPRETSVRGRSTVTVRISVKPVNAGAPKPVGEITPR